MRMLMGGLAEIELPCLAVVIGETLGADAAFHASFSDRSAVKAFSRRFARRVGRQGIGLVAFGEKNVGYASSLGLLLAAIIAVFTWLQFRVVRRDIG